MASDMANRLRNWAHRSNTAEPSPNGSEQAATAMPSYRPDGAEPLSSAERALAERAYARVLRSLDLTHLGKMDEMRGRTEIHRMAEEVMTQESMPLAATVRQRIAIQIEDEILGLGPIEPLLADRSVSDVLVNGCDQVYVERHGKLQQTDIRFRDDAHLMGIIERIVARVGRRIDESSPMVDARLADGSRVNAIIPPLAIDGPMLSIRRFTVERMTMDELVALDTVNLAMTEIFRGIVRGRLNVLISGGTGSGKTTLLNVLTGFIPATERVITIEDSAELQLQQPHVCRLETRPRNIEGKGEVTQRDLVRNALRMRPDRIIVGEVRGGEAFDMLQAMNTGHDGSLTTIHANSPRDALSRVENMIAMAAMGLPSQAAREQIASAINVVIQLERMEDGRRRVTSIQEIEGMEGPIITMSEIYRFVRRGHDPAGRVIGAFEGTGIVPRFLARLRSRGIDIPLDAFHVEGRE